MADDFIVYNPGGAAVMLGNLGVEIPASEDYNLLAIHDIEILKTDTELLGHLSVGTLLRRVGGALLPAGDAFAEEGPVGTAQQAWTPATQIPITFNGQTSLALSSIPVDSDSIELKINGVVATLGLDYTVIGAAITWLNREFILETSDEVYVKYLKPA